MFGVHEGLGLSFWFRYRFGFSVQCLGFSTLNGLQSTGIYLVLGLGSVLQMFKAS